MVSNPNTICLAYYSLLISVIIFSVYLGIPITTFVPCHYFLNIILNFTSPFIYNYQLSNSQFHDICWDINRQLTFIDHLTCYNLTWWSYSKISSSDIEFIPPALLRCEFLYFVRQSWLKLFSIRVLSHRWPYSWINNNR